LDFSIILAIIGLLLSLFFGVLSIYLAVKKPRYPGKILVAEIDSENLINRLIYQIQNISIKYENIQIANNNLILKTFRIINIGDKDITSHMVEKPIKLTFPNKSKLLAINYYSTAEHKLSIKLISEKEASFHIKKSFRRNEEFFIQALIETPIILVDNKDFTFLDLTKIRIDCRIIDTEVNLILKPLSLFNKTYSTAINDNFSMVKLSLFLLLVICIWFIIAYTIIQSKKIVGILSILSSIITISSMSININTFKFFKYFKLLKNIKYKKYSNMSINDSRVFL